MVDRPCFFDERRFRVRIAEAGCRTAIDVAALTGYSVDYVGQLMRGRIPSSKARVAISKAIQARPDEIWPLVAPQASR